MWLDGRLLCRATTFVSLFLNRKAIHRVGLPIRDYFIWGDDTEYTMRIAREYPSYFVQNSQVTHKMKSNEGTAAIENVTDINRIDRMYYSIRNDFCTMKRICFRKTAVFIVAQIHSLAQTIKSAQPYKGRKIKIIFKGIVGGTMVSSYD